MTHNSERAEACGTVNPRECPASNLGNDPMASVDASPFRAVAVKVVPDEASTGLGWAR
jgi:hypothetical protein